ncbi:MAG: iron dependent repressor, metal binding and dimerization domain protein, partial [Nitriliruptoraceae bacterium]
DLIDSTEMYLRTVLELEEEGIPALRARLSERLNLSAPSVSEGVARLEEQGLLKLAADRTVRLTDTGRDKALHVMRKHRLAERLLADVIGLDPAYIHDEACRWEHVISDRVEEKIADLLGNPTTSPYGNPIPGAEVDEVQLVPLAEADPGPVRLHSISESLQRDATVIGELHANGMLAGEIVDIARDGDTIELSHGGHRITVTPDAARLIYVTTNP